MDGRRDTSESDPVNLNRRDPARPASVVPRPGRPRQTRNEGMAKIDNAEVPGEPLADENVDDVLDEARRQPLRTRPGMTNDDDVAGGIE